MADRVNRPQPPQQRRRRRNRNTAHQQRGNHQPQLVKKPVQPAVVEKAADYPSYPWANSDLALSRQEHENSDFWASEPKHVSTYAGSGHFGHDDGDLKNATFIQPQFVLISPLDGRFFVSERRHRIRVITPGPNGEVSLFAGSKFSGFENGHRLAARFDRPGGICFDMDNNLIVCDTNNHRIRHIDLRSDMVTTLAGSGKFGTADGPYLDAQFQSLSSVTIGPDGAIYVSDRSIRRIFAGQVQTIAMTSQITGSYAPPLPTPSSIVYSPKEHLLYLSDRLASGYARVMTLDPVSGVFKVLPPVPANNMVNTTQGPLELGFAPDGSLIASDSYTNKLLRFRNGTWAPFAGSGQRTCTNGHMADASFSPCGFTFSPDNVDMYLCDIDGHRLRKIHAPFESEAHVSGVSLESLIDVLNCSSTQDLIQSRCFTLRHAASNREWRLLECVVRQIAPFLVSSGGKKVFEQLNCPISVLETFLKIIHGMPLSQLLNNAQSGGETDLPVLSFLSDLHVISRALGVPELTRYIAYELKREILRFKSLEPGLFLNFVESIISRHGYRTGKRPSLESSWNTSDFSKTLLRYIVVCLSSKEGFLNLITRVDSLLNTSPFADSLQDLLHSPDFSVAELASESVPLRLDESVPHDVGSFFRHTLSSFLAELFEEDISDSSTPIDKPNYTITASGRIFNVHDWVLISQWPLFARALKFGGNELKSRNMELSDLLSSEAAECLLRFLYTHIPPSVGLDNSENSSDEITAYHDYISRAADSLITNAEFLTLVEANFFVPRNSSFLPLINALVSVISRNETRSDHSGESKWASFVKDYWWKAKWQLLNSAQEIQ